MQGLPRLVHLFTDTLTHSTFAIPASVPSVEEIMTERDKTRAKFKVADSATPGTEGRGDDHRRPLFNRAPRKFVAADIGNHY